MTIHAVAGPGRGGGMGNGLQLILIGMVLAALLLAGCAGSPPAAPVLNASGNPIATPTPAPSAAQPSTPSPILPPVPPGGAAGGFHPTPVNPTTGGLNWSNKKALVLTVLKLNETAVFDGGRLRLVDLTRAGTPTATLEVEDTNGNAQGQLSLALDQAMEFRASDQIDYLAVAVFDLTEGVSNSVQVGIYRVLDLTAPAPRIKVGEPQNAFTMNSEFPAPKLLKNDTVAVGGRISVSAFDMALTRLEVGASPPKASYSLLDSQGQSMAIFDLQAGQMAAFTAADGHRYNVAFRRADGKTAVTEVYQAVAFAS